MARVQPARALTLVDSGITFRRGQPVHIEDEGLYSRLIHNGRLQDIDKDWQSIHPAKTLPKLRAGTIVYVTREMGLGDILMVLPVIRALKKKYPHLLFRFATGRNFVKLVEGLDFLESVVSIMDHDGRHANTIELRGLSERHPERTRMDRIDIFGLYCGVQVTDYTLPIPEVTDAERMHARSLIGSGSTIAVAVRGSTGLRSWPMDNVRAFAKEAAHAGWTVALLDGQRQEFEEHPRIKNMTGQLSLLEVKNVIAESDFCISPDTGIQHLSEAVRTRCLALYSVIPPELRIGHYSYVKAFVRKDLPCYPCWHRGCKPYTCMTSITPAMVLSALENWDALERYTNPIKPFAVVSPSTA